MPYAVRESEEDGCHHWAVVDCTCDLDNPEDQLISEIVAVVREAYGEADVLAAIQPDEDVGSTFDLAAVTAAVTRAFRRGLPNPGTEKGKKPHLTNYRSETVEFVARGALRIAHEINYPTHPQRGKTNVNQPVLGFDGWGLFHSAETGFVLVLIQVKGTDEDRVPPREAEKLAEECARVPGSVDEVCRALSVMIANLHPSSERNALVEILASLSEVDILPRMLIAPVVVRGLVQASAGDLEPVREVAGDVEPCGMRGVSVSLGVDLAAFGQLIMTRARAA